MDGFVPWLSCICLKNVVFPDNSEPKIKSLNSLSLFFIMIKFLGMSQIWNWSHDQIACVFEVLGTTGNPIIYIESWLRKA